MKSASDQAITIEKQDVILPSTIVRLRSARTILIAIALVGVLLRIGSALVQGNGIETLPGVYDQVSYDGLARRLIAGYGFSFAEDHWPLTRAGEPTAHWSYLYTVYLALVYTIAGPQPLIARIVQAVIAGVLHCWLAWRIGRRIGGQIVGFVSAVLSATYIYFWYYAGALMTETFYIVAILWTFDCAFRLMDVSILDSDRNEPPKVRWKLWFQLGMAIGVTLLLRQVFLLFVPFLFLWLGYCLLPNRRQAQKHWGAYLRAATLGMILCGLVVMVLILPWTIRNYRAFGTFVPLNTNSGYAFFWGNHPIYGTHFVGILPADGPSYQDLVPQELRHLNEAELDKALLKRGIDFVLDDPVRYGLLSMSRTIEYFKFWPSSESGTLSNLARVGSFGILLPFILYGTVRVLVNAWRTQNQQKRAVIVLLVLFVTIYTGVHLLTWALIRYRLPVDAVLLFFAAIAIVELWNKRNKRAILTDS